MKFGGKVTSVFFMRGNFLWTEGRRCVSKIGSQNTCYPIGLTSLIMKSISPLLESELSLLSVFPTEYSRSDCVKLPSLGLKKSMVSAFTTWKPMAFRKEPLFQGHHAIEKPKLAMYREGCHMEAH